MLSVGWWSMRGEQPHTGAWTTALRTAARLEIVTNVYTRHDQGAEG